MSREALVEPSQKIVVVIDAEIAPLVPAFLANRRKDVVQMREALEQKEFQTLLVTGHGMKGAGGGYGFDAVSEIGRQIELAAKEQNGVEIARQVDELERYLDRVEIVTDDS